MTLFLALTLAFDWTTPVHATICATAPVAAYDVLRACRVSRPVATWTALGGMACIAAGKEWLDYRNGGGVSWQDIAADAVGLGVAALIIRWTGWGSNPVALSQRTPQPRPAVGQRHTVSPTAISDSAGK